MQEQRSWLPLVAVIIIAVATLGLLYWVLHRAGAAPQVKNYTEATSESALQVFVQDKINAQKGRELFIKNCTLCHGTQGQGLVGPNLRDDYWLRGAHLQNISESIANGNPVRGMAAWSPVLSPEEIHMLVAYIVSLQGSEDGSGKAPEGVQTPMKWLTNTP